MALVDTLRDLADLFRQTGADAQARTLDRLVAEDEDDLPSRVLDLYSQGMGGMYDPYLEPEADKRRQDLAEKAFREARELRGGG